MSQEIVLFNDNGKAARLIRRDFVYEGLIPSSINDLLEVVSLVRLRGQNQKS